MDQATPVASEKTRPQVASKLATAPHQDSAPASRWLWIRIAISLLLMILFLSVAGLVFLQLSSQKQAPPRETPAPRVLRVETFQVERSRLRQFVSGFGTARADREVVVSAEVAGRVQETIDGLKVGHEVHGKTVTLRADGTSQQRDADILVQIDPHTYEERLNQAHSMLMQDATAAALLKEEHATNQELAKQQVRRIETIQREYDRREHLLVQGAGAETELERARLELEQYRETQIRLQKEIQLYPIRQEELQARMNSHQSDLNLAELDLEKATVRAPFSGQLSEVSVEEGQYVQPGDPLVRITDLSLIEVPVPLSLVGAAQVERLLKSGETVSTELARSAEDFVHEGAQVWHGQLKRIAPLVDERTRTVLAFVEVRNDEQEVPLRAGAFVYARLEAGVIPESRGVLIPRDTIIDGTVFVAEKSSSGKSEQWIAAQRKIDVSDHFQTFALVTRGLEDSDLVVMTNLDIIQPGDVLSFNQAQTLQDEFLRLRVPYLQQIPSSSSASE